MSCPFIIGIGGSHSKVGKTTLAETLLKHFSSKVQKFKSSKEKNSELKTRNSELNKWGAIKYTKTAIYCSIIDTPDILNQKGKDTRRLFDAGAEEVLWVQSPSEEISEVLPLAVNRLSHLKGIIIEGNSAIEFSKPDIVIFIFGKDDKPLKKSAINILSMADIITFQHKPSVGLPVKAKRFKLDPLVKDDYNKLMRHIDTLLT
jgi:molybdopterin-guanine dinucleotide biosynthesis protein